ncbi:MAG: hypothetical protein UIH99_03955 [Alphaproteobacteria bacterium]|jgi:hypothetical protein|nr:hypothetical protein [Alphaproteobacteria bacterium]
MINNSIRVIRVVGTYEINKKNPETVLSTVISCANCKKNCRNAKRCTVVRGITHIFSNARYHYKCKKPVLNIELTTKKINDALRLIQKAREASYQM